MDLQDIKNDDRKEISAPVESVACLHNKIPVFILIWFITLMYIECSLFNKFYANILTN